jgi:hypothetical protein
VGRGGVFPKCQIVLFNAVMFITRSDRHGLGRTIAAAVLGFALLASAQGLAYAQARTAQSGTPQSSTARTSGNGVPELLGPTVTHEPDAYELLGVSCSSVRHCLAVGYGDGPSFGGGVAVPITNGVAGKPVESTDQTSVFRADACVSASECLIVGEGTPPGTSSVQAEVWLLRGRTLKLIDQRGSLGNVSSNFRAAACWSGRACEVAGDAVYDSKTLGQSPTSIFGRVSLSGTPSVTVFDAGALAYTAAVACPSDKECYAGGATVSEAGAVADINVSRQADVTGPIVQPTVAGLEAIACTAVTSCGAAEVEYLPDSQMAGWVEHLNQRAQGTPVAVADAELMFGIAAVNPTYYLAVGSVQEGGWLTDLMTSSGRALTPGVPGEPGYLQAVTCPVQTECIAAGFSTDSASVQPGGLDGVDGAIAVFHLKTAPSAPGLAVKSATHSAVTLRIVPPGSNGGVAVTRYEVVVSRCRPGHKACQLEKVKTVSAPATSRTVTVTGLARGTTYYFRAAATNAIGTGPFSATVHCKG